MYSSIIAISVILYSSIIAISVILYSSVIAISALTKIRKEAVKQKIEKEMKERGEEGEVDIES